MRRSIHIDQAHNDAIRAEVAERLRIILRLSPPQRVPRLIREQLDRLTKQGNEIELKSSPSIVPSQNEGWLRKLLGSRRR
jgi:hypothetical protein